MEKSIKKLCYLALFCAIAIVLSYIESLIPLYLGAPGAKLGLANVVTLTLLLCFGLKEAFIVMFLRILIVSMTFTNFYMFLYSLSGGLLSLIIMYLFLKTNLFSDIIISIMGGIFHNVGQLLVAMLFFSSTVFMYYLPYLMLFGILSGIVIGILGEIIYLKIGNQLKKRGQKYVYCSKNRNNANLSLVIKYKAIVKSEKVENTVVPNDGNHTFTPKTNTLYTAKITMTKTGDASAKLEGAGFVVYRVDGEKTYYALVVKDISNSNNEYVVTGWTENFETAKAENNLVMTDSKGKVVVRGLDDSYTYKFKEVKAPEGYSVNTDDSSATWDTATAENPQTPDKRTGTASMTDTKLSALPSTGGIGTTIFTIGGCAIMIVAAGLFFATRRKTQK